MAAADPRRAAKGLLRRALLRRIRGRPSADSPERVVILLSSAWGMGGTIRAGINMAGWLARTRDVHIITTFRSRDEPFFGQFPPGVSVTPLIDRRRSHAPRGLRGVAFRRLRRITSVLYPEVDRHRKDHSLWTDLRLVSLLRGGRGVLVGTRPGYNLMIASLDLPGYLTIGLEQMHLGNHKPKVRKQMKRLYPRLDGFVALTAQDARAYDELLEGRVKVGRIPNTVARLGGENSDPAIRAAMAAGRLGLIGQKGFDLLVRAWAPVAERHPDWRLRIYGDGPLRPRLESMIADLGIGAVVELPGATKDMGSTMAEHSIFVLSSRFEGFPLILLEAMSKGLACVAFDCPTGPADIIDDHRTGLIVPAEDVEALSRGIIEMIEDEELRRGCAAAAPATVDDYTMESVGPRWEAFISEVEAAATASRGA